MPELPEVETVANGVHQRAKGQRIVSVWLSSHKQPFKTHPRRLAEGLEGRAILRVHRVGKHIVCELGPQGDSKKQNPAQWVVHLGMTGRLLVTGAENPVAPHTHARLTLADGREIRFIDPRRFGRLELRDLARDTPFAAAGVEPLTVEKEAFAALFHPRKLSIKAALLNQSLLTGVGNIYADESLFRARIRPTRIAGSLTRAELERLRLALKQVLLHSIELGGSSVSDYVDADGVRGFYQLEHNVYLRTGEPCKLCSTPIQRLEVAGRGTHFCPKCQPSR